MKEISIGTIFDQLGTHKRRAANGQPQIEHIMWGRQAAWSSLWWWHCFPYYHEFLPIVSDTTSLGIGYKMYLNTTYMCLNKVQPAETETRMGSNTAAA